jgi:hypothetical protein
MLGFHSFIVEMFVLVAVLVVVALVVVDKQRWLRWRVAGAVVALAMWVVVANVLMEVFVVAVIWYADPVVHWVCCSGTPYQRFYPMPKPLHQPSPPPAPVIDHNFA